MTRRPSARCIGRIIALVLAILLPAAVGRAQQSLRIAVLSDPHVTEDPRRADHLDHLREAIRQVNDSRPDVVLIAGDLTDHGTDRQLEQAKLLFAELKPTPYVVAGNHDVGGIPSGDKPGPSQQRLDLYQKIIGPHFYTADLPRGMKLVALDSSLFGSGNPLENAQWNLLERELGPSVPDRSRILLMHYPPFVNTADEADEYMSLNRPERQRFLKLLETKKAAVVITGHQHRPREVNSSEIKIVTAPPISFGLPREKQAPGWMLVEVGQDRAIRTEVHELRVSAGDAPNPRVHIFYYPWYGAPPFENEYVHWVQGGHTPPKDIGSSFYPALGPYSSSDPKVLQQHMKWIRQSRAGVLVVSWWGQNRYEDQRVPSVMDAAAAAGLKVAFHVEPYDGFTPERAADDIKYLLDRYGKHPAFYRSAEQGGKPVFYNFESLRFPAQDWRKALDRMRGQLEPFILLAQTSDLTFINAAGFDGGYTYDVLTPFRDTSFLMQWGGGLASRFAAQGKLFVPSVGPGYSDERAVNRRDPLPANARTRDGGKASTYELQWRAAIAANPPFVTVTSFNEWHEGSQIEPAKESQGDGYHYPAYTGGELQYIELTADWVQQFAKASPTTQPAASSRSADREPLSKRVIYLKNSKADWNAMLPPPPAPGSPEEKNEIQEVLSLQQERTAAQARQCKLDEAFQPFTFAETLGSSFNPDDLPFTAEFLKNVLNDVNRVSEAAKREFDRKRPYLVDDRVEPCINRVNSRSYPSGHSTRGVVLAAVVAEIFPEKTDELLAIGDRIGHSRVLGGVHFPSDVEAGRTLGKRMVEEMKADPAFQADLQKAREECRSRTPQVLRSPSLRR